MAYVYTYTRLDKNEIFYVGIGSDSKYKRAKNLSLRTDYFKKILVYNKYLKESRYKNLDDELKNWKRLEVTVNIKFKFKDFVLDDYLEDMQNLAKKYFNVLSFSYEYLELQNKLLTDKRTHKGTVQNSVSNR